MKRDLILVVAILLIIAIVVVGLVVFKNKNKKNTQEPYIDRTIDPKPFGIGLDRDPLKKSANLCYPNEMYSNAGVYVDYGIPSIPDDCPCLEFIRAP